MSGHIPGDTSAKDLIIRRLITGCYPPHDWNWLYRKELICCIIARECRMRLVLSQHHKDYEFRLLQAASGYEVSIADAQGKTTARTGQYTDGGAGLEEGRRLIDTLTVSARPDGKSRRLA
jgi:hypothetical protein